jgi:hypothetical protein
LFAACVGARRGRAHRLPPGHPRDRQRGCDGCFTSHLRGRQEQVTTRLPGHPPDQPRGCDGSVTALIGGHRGHARRLPPGHPRDRRRRCDGSFRSHIRGRQELVTGRLLEMLGSIHPAATTHSPRASGAVDDVLTGQLRDCLQTIRARASALFTGHHLRRPRFGVRGILRKYRDARNPESKTEGKIKRSHLDCFGPRIAKRFSVAGHLANSAAAP